MYLGQLRASSLLALAVGFAAASASCDAGPRDDDPRGPAVTILGTNVGIDRPLPADGAIEVAFDRYLFARVDHAAVVHRRHDGERGAHRGAGGGRDVRPDRARSPCAARGSPGSSRASSTASSCAPSGTVRSAG